MGNMFERQIKPKSESNSLSRSLLHHDLIEKINYLNDKVDMLDDKIFVLESNSQANLKVLSADIHLLNNKLNKMN